MRTFAIGDVHGHLDRLEALLRAEGIIGRCPACNGMGNTPCPDPGLLDYECSKCDGNGVARIDDDTLVVQLGDLGHFGAKGNGPTADMLCWQAVHKSHWCDIVLWGNHDRAIVDDGHAFNGFERPRPETLHYISMMHNDGRLMLAYEADGHLLTHAGLHKVFRTQKLDKELKTNVIAFVDWINDQDDEWLDTYECDPEAAAIRDAISTKRGGRSDYGGLLWRDARESLFPGWPQIFGHTKGELIRTYNNDSYCIDLGSPDNGRLAGMWLPERKFVQINTNRRDKNGDAEVVRFPA